MLRIRKTKLDIPRHKWLILNAVKSIEGAFNCLTLGVFSAEWYAPILFSEWIEKYDC